MFSFNFPPKGWAFCNGQSMPINQNQALFSLLGTVFGGNGQTTFNLPNLRGRLPLHFDGTYTLGAAAGQEAHTLTISEMPSHTHQGMVSPTNANINTPGGNVFGAANNVYRTPPDNFTTLHPASITNYGQSQPHTNMQPYLVINFCIALQGIFPSQN